MLLDTKDKVAEALLTRMLALSLGEAWSDELETFVSAFLKMRETERE